MKQSRKMMIGALIIAISAVIAVAGYLVLPEVMIVQIGIDGKASNTLPKIPALLLPFAISTISALLYMKEATSRPKNLVLALIGLAIAVFAFIMNFGR